MLLRSRSLSDGTSDGAQAVSKTRQSKTDSFFIILYLVSERLIAVRDNPILAHLFHAVICVVFFREGVYRL